MSLYAGAIECESFLLVTTGEAHDKCVEDGVRRARVGALVSLADLEASEPDSECPYCLCLDLVPVEGFKATMGDNRVCGALTSYALSRIRDLINLRAGARET